MGIWLKQSTAADVVVGPFVDDTDGKTAETGLTISQADCQLSKNGGAVAQKNDATSASHLGGGHYKVPLNTTDTNTLGRLRLYVNEGGALPVWVDYMIVSANVWDSLFGADYLQVDAAQWLGQTIAAVDTNGYPKVTVKSGTGTGEIAITSGVANANAVQLSGDSTAADNAESFFDGTGYAGGTIKLGVDAVAISGDTTAADNAEAMFDGTGYAGGTIKLGVDAVAVSGDSAAADTLETIIEGATPLAVNATQIGGSATAATNAARGFQGLVLATAVTGTLTTTSFTTSLSEATNDHYNGRTLTFTSGALAGQMTTITDYVGATKVVTVTAMTEAPANGDTFFIA